MSPAFLEIDDVVRLHSDQVAAFGGSDGSRDSNLLASALAQPSATFLHEDLFAMAAAYLFHIVMNHPFVDGNKRTGLAAAVVFLDLNGFTTDRSATDRLFEITLAVAEGRLDKAGLAEASRGLPWSDAPGG